MKIFSKCPTVNISKLNFWLLICIAKDFYFFAPSDSRFSNSCISAKYCPILTNHTSMKSFFIVLWLVLWSRVTNEDILKNCLCFWLFSERVCVPTGFLADLSLPRHIFKVRIYNRRIIDGNVIEASRESWGWVSDKYFQFLTNAW